MAYKIGELAARTGCPVVTIRYYEKEGLLEEPSRTVSGYRLYGEPDLERLYFIRHCRAHGMSQDEIKTLLKYQRDPEGDCLAVNRLVDRHLAEVEERIAELTRLKRQLEMLRRSCPGSGTMAECGILKGLRDSTLCPCHQDGSDGSEF